MKTLPTIALGALALGVLGTSAFAAETTKLAPPVFRCTSCGVKYLVKTNVGKDNSIQMKLERLPAVGNPKGH